jgi:hypothetical protein
MINDSGGVRIGFGHEFLAVPGEAGVEGEDCRYA